MFYVSIVDLVGREKTARAPAILLDGFQTRDFASLKEALASLDVIRIAIDNLRWKAGGVR